MTSEEACAIFAPATVKWLEKASAENVRRSWQYATRDFKTALWRLASARLKAEIRKLTGRD